jgi:hypothetical protein
VNASASTLPPGTHGPGIVFTNLSSGRGNTIRFARLIVRRPPLSRPTDQTERGPGGYLLDDRGGYLLDDRGRRLLAQRSAARRQPRTARENPGRAARSLARFFPAQPQTRNFATCCFAGECSTAGMCVGSNSANIQRLFDRFEAL